MLDRNILIINPANSEEMTKAIEAHTRTYISSSTKITVLHPQDGPAFLGNAYDVAIQTPRMLDLIKKNEKNYDSIIIACGIDPGLDACRTVTDKLVIGAGEASIMTACSVAKRFSFFAVMETTKSVRMEQLRNLGIDPSRCTSVRVVGSGKDDSIVRQRNERREEYYRTGEKCVNEDGAGALILGCAGMTGIKEYLEKRLRVPVIDIVINAVKLAEQF